MAALRGPGGRGRAVALAMLIGALGLLASGLAGYSNHMQSQAHIRERFEDVILKTQARAEERVNVFLALLSPSSAFLAGPERLNADSFRAYALLFSNERDFPGLQAMGYAAYPRPGEGKTAAATLGDTDHVAPVWYVAFRADSHVQGLGKDLHDLAEVRTALDQARDSGHAVISGPVMLFEEEGIGQPPPVLMLSPVYRQGQPHITEVQRRQAITGFVFVVVRMNVLLASIGLDAGIDMEIYDGAGTDPDRMLFDEDMDRRNRTAPWPLESVHSSVVGGRAWTWYFGAMPAFAHDPHEWLAGLIAGGGAVLTVLLAALVFVTTSARARAEAEAARMTERYLQRNKALADNVRELNYQKTVLDAHAIVSLTDRDGAITYVNDQFCDISGYPFDELIGRSYRLFKSERHTPEFFAETWATIASGNIWQGEVCNRKRDGREFWLQTTIVPFLGKDGKPERYVSASTDITELKQAQAEIALHRDHLQDLVGRRTRELLLAKQAAESADRAKSEFLANMSHELRTPMHAILSYSELGTERTQAGNLPTDKAQAYFERIHESGKRLLDLIDDLLDLSKMEAGRMRYEMRESDLCMALQRVSQHLASLLRDKALQLEMAMLPERARAVFDATRIEQVLINLLSNAIKYSPQGGIIAVTCREAELPGRRADDSHHPGWQICISDQGPGIPDQELELVFDKFAQASHSKNGAGGTGLGLAICREIIFVHHGHIWAENIATGGLQLVFEFPADLPASVSASAAS